MCAYPTSASWASTLYTGGTKSCSKVMVTWPGWLPMRLISNLSLWGPLHASQGACQLSKQQGYQLPNAECTLRVMITEAVALTVAQAHAQHATLFVGYRLCAVS